MLLEPRPLLWLGRALPAPLAALLGAGFRVTLFHGVEAAVHGRMALLGAGVVDGSSPVGLAQTLWQLDQMVPELPLVVFAPTWLGTIEAARWQVPVVGEAALLPAAVRRVLTRRYCSGAAVRAS